jgi:hypothetical protein
LVEIKNEVIKMTKIIFERDNGYIIVYADGYTEYRYGDDGVVYTSCPSDMDDLTDAERHTVILGEYYV